MNMRLLVSVILLFCMNIVIAQKQICGDWIGIAHETALKEHSVTGNMIRVDEKLYIRIRQIDGKYQVRMKSQIVDGSRPYSYLPECKVIPVTEEMIKWSQDWGSNEDEDLGTEQGVIVGKDSQIAYYTAVLTDGALKLSEEYKITYYDRQGRVITTKTFQPHYSKGVILYREESDW